MIVTVAYSPSSRASGSPLHRFLGDRTVCGRPIGPDWQATTTDHTDRRICRPCTRREAS